MGSSPACLLHFLFVGGVAGPAGVPASLRTRGRFFGVGVLGMLGVSGMLLTGLFSQRGCFGGGLCGGDGDGDGDGLPEVDVRELAELLLRRGCFLSGGAARSRSRTRCLQLCSLAVNTDFCSSEIRGPPRGEVSCGTSAGPQAL